MVELLAPAGSFESLRAAVNAGADAVYIGGSMFGARAYAENPDEDRLIEGIKYCHLHGRKLYLTVNTLLKEEELTSMLYQYLLPYYKNGLDGVIVQDFGVLRYIQQYFPGLEIHASTQMTITGPEGARLLKGLGVTRAVPARELSLKEIRSIIDQTGIEVECFIHGAMCYSYSGQCLFSSMLGGRSGNRGRCAQPCRLPYRVLDKSGNEISAYLLSMKDMCTIELLPDLIDAGIASMKIEGRMKRAEYTAGVVSIYRKYIDIYQKHGRTGYRVSEEDMQALQDLYNRGGFSQGYYRIHNGREMMAMSRPNHQGTEAAMLKRTGKGGIQAAALEQLHKGDVLELGKDHEITLPCDVKKNALFPVRAPKALLRPGSVVYRTKNEYLLRQIYEAYIVRDCKEKIKGDLRIFSGSPAILKLWNEKADVTVTGNIAEIAEKNPATEESVRKQMQKTGNTPFVFDSLNISLEENLFVSVKKLNGLRRNALAKLEQAIQEKSQRKEYNRFKGEEDNKKSKGTAYQKGTFQAAPEYKLNVAVTYRSQLEAVLSVPDADIDTIYLDTMLFCGTDPADTMHIRTDEAADAVRVRNGDAADAMHFTDGEMPAVSEPERMMQEIKAAGIKCCINCPPVFRDRERNLFEKDAMKRLMMLADGFLLHTIDELSYFRRFAAVNHPAAELIADDNFYAYNHQAEQFLREQGISRTVLPAELNYRELLRLGAREKELIVYGYQPLMHSAQCVQKNAFGCTKLPAILYLQDRKNARFPVLNRCHLCCNTIYNSVPLQLGGCRSELQALSPSFLRLSFTVEPAKDVRRILQLYHELLFAEHSTYDPDLGDTRGHFKRGVE